MEPAACGLPILTGPHVFKNRAEYSALSEAGVVSEIADGDSLAGTARAICGDADRLAAIATAARAHAAKAGKRPAKAAKLCLALVQDR